jgi:ABC-type dipeptide/oligopeptide/nickel transport system permease subunit
MGIILGIFLTKYAVGVTMAMQPAVAKQTLFALAIGSLYGVFSGYFAGRTLRLWRLTQAHTPST